MLTIVASTCYVASDRVRGSELRVECIDCHGEDGMGDEEYPKISGIEEAYILGQLMAFKNSERLNRAEMMLWAMEDLEEQDLGDLAAYFSSQKGQ